MKEYYLVLKYKDLLNHYNNGIYELDINHETKRVSCDINHYHFDIMIEYKYNL